jgi:hypothetical protein
MLRDSSDKCLVVDFEIDYQPYGFKIVHGLRAVDDAAPCGNNTPCDTEGANGLFFSLEKGRVPESIFQLFERDSIPGLQEGICVNTQPTKSLGKPFCQSAFPRAGHANENDVLLILPVMDWAWW